MKTKRYNKKYSNKTRKIRTKTNKTTSKPTIENVYLKDDKELQNEKHLSCFLINNHKIKHFALNIFYYMLNYWKTIMSNKWYLIIKHSLIQKLDKNTIIKIGFTEHEFKTIVDLINKKDKLKLTTYLEPKFLKVTASINNLCEPEYTIYHVNANKNLQQTFIHYFEKIMLTTNITWKTIMQFYKSLKNKKDILRFNFFVFDLIYGSDKDIDSIYRDNLGNMDFFRTKLTKFNHNKSDYKKIDECNKSIVNDDEYSNYGIYTSAESNKIQANSPYAYIMKIYKQYYLGGPSGSTALMYINLFHLYKYPFTYRNKIMLLGMLIADYVPLWHTIPEILLSAYPEFKDNKIKRFTLDQNATLYSIKLLKEFV